MIALANYISELKAENQTLQRKVEELNNSLKAEREMVDKLLKEKDKIINEQLEIINNLLQATKPSLLDKANTMAGGAGIASMLILLAVLN